ncbi:MAG: exo-alpha-sialidase [Chthonomonadales bacterium]|nr:exo-alpha-sialidase [Chthonomonadales bacterium]
MTTAAPDETALPRLDTATRTIAVRGGGYFPVLIQLKDGRLAAVVRGGAPHLGKAGRLDWIESKDGGKTWSEPTVLVDGPWDDRNPAVGQMRNGTIVVAYAECSAYNADGSWNPNTGSFALYYVTSKDGGKTWFGRRPLNAGPIGRVGSPYGRIVTLKDGTSLMSVYGEADPAYDGPGKPPAGSRGDLVGILRSRDNGETWGDFSLVSAADHNETALLPMPDGRILAAMRTGKGQLDVCESADGGRTWSPPAPVTGGPDRAWPEHPADLVHLSGKRVLMLTGRRHAPLGVMAITSKDGGRTWDYAGRHLVAWTSQNGDCGYPSGVRLRDGTIVCLYYSVGTTELPGVEQAIAVRFADRALP